MCDGSDDRPASQQVVNTAEPPAFLLGPLQEAVEVSRLQATQPREFFPGQTFAPAAPETELGLQLQTQRAMAGSPTLDAANTQVQQTLEGDFAVNPFRDELTQSIINQIRPAVDAPFIGNAGGLQSGARANSLASTVTDRLAPFAFGARENERGRQIQAAQLAPGLAQGDFQDAAALAQVGATREGIAQQGIDESIQRFNFGQIEPLERLQRHLSNLGQTNFGGVTTSQSSARQAGTSPIANVIGGAASGAGLLRLLGII